MKNWTIAKRITAGFATLLAVFLGFAALVGWQNRNVTGSVNILTTDSLPGVRYTGQLLQETLEYRVLTLQHIISTNHAEMVSIDKLADDKAEQILETLEAYRKTVTRSEEKPLVERIGPAFSAYREKAKIQRGLSLAGKSGEAADMIPMVGAIFAACNKTVMDCRDINIKWAAEATAAANSSLATAQKATWIAVILGLAVGIALSVMIARSVAQVLSRIASALDEGSDQVAAAAGQVSSASQTLAEGASEQAASLEETSSSLEEMASMTRRNSENAEKANALARQARTAADQGAEDMQSMNAAMEAIKTSSDDIAKIIKTIDEIAFQTNILALNAAVEAARAGEAGMGFAVVADEVRNLAQRCAQSAKETSTKIEGAITKSAQGVEISTKVTHGLQEIVTKARQVDELVSEVTSASREQSQGVSQVNTAVGQMDKVTQSNAATAEESASAAEELNAQAQSLKEAVVELLGLVGGRAKVAASGTKHRSPAHGTAPLVAIHRNGAHTNGRGTASVRNNLAPALSTDVKRDMLPLEGDFRDM
ncbi:MAG TPA: methyl-accepting chemotaxis protein [Verrucomicrobiae bacterium]|nr:methyl-accepting chemotaxis protein [Verrucomicrobiae bacterium]